MSYANKLRDPRWRKLRMDVLNMRGHKCQDCGRGNGERAMESDEPLDECRLEVHHGYYVPQCEPWDYPVYALIVLCGACHHHRHTIEREVAKALARLSTDTLEKVFAEVKHLHANV